MDRNVVLGFVSGVLATCVVGWLARSDGPPNEASAPVERRAPGRPLPRAELPQAERAPIEVGDAEIPGDAGTFERVVRKIAEYSGDGIIRCDVGDKLPEGPVSGIGRAWVENGVLIGSVEDPQGQARIQLTDDPMSDPPRVVVKWADAWPGDTGSCTVLAPKRVLVTGQLVDPSGHAVFRGEVGNLVDGTHPVSADGRFAAMCWQGAVCPLGARRSAGEAFGSFVTVVPDHPMSGLVLVLDVPDAENLEDFLARQVAEDERLAHQPDPLVLALADPELPAETRPVVERWLAEEQEGRSVARALLAEVATR